MIKQKERELKESDAESKAGKQVEERGCMVMERMEVTQGRFYLEGNKGKQFLTKGKLCRPGEVLG